MHIKLKKNRSGTTTVQIVEAVRIVGSKYPRPRLVKTLGVATTHAEIDQLKQQAQNYLNSIPAVQKKCTTNGELVVRAESDIESCKSTIIGFGSVFEKLYKDIFYSTTLKAKGNEMLSQLAIMRIIEPKSKNYTASVAQKYGYNLKVDNIYKLMDRIDEEAISQIQSCAYTNTKRLLKESAQELDVIFYDLTSIYFETNAKDELRNFGFSKDGKSHHVQIMLAIIVTNHGLPIAYETFEGNTYEGNTLIPTLDKLRNKYQIRRVIVIADSGLISKKNVELIAAAGIEYVIGARLKNSPQEIIKEALNNNNYEEINEIVKGKEYIINKKGSQEPSDHKMMLYYSSKRAAKEEHDREKALKKVREQLGQKAKSKLSGALRKSYVKLSKEEAVIEIDEDKLEEAAKFDGFFGLQTNIKGSSPKEILHYYSGLWQVEQTFRITKYNVKIRPVFHYNTGRIKAHFAICYISLVLIRTIEFKMRQSNCYIALEQLIKLLEEVEMMTIISKGVKCNIMKDFPQELVELYKCLKIKIPFRLTFA